MRTLNNISKKDLISYLKEIAKLYGMKAHVQNIGPWNIGGWANLDGTFVVNSNQKKIRIIDCFFHELAHELNRVDGKFKEYHNYDIWHMKDIAKAKKILKRTAWRAEQYTDKRGAVLMSFWFPEYEYNFIYSGDRAKKWLLSNFE